MPVQSKWQQLPTEAINPASLAIDKLSPAAIIDLMVDEDRKVLAAVAKEKERIALGVEIISQALRKGGRLVFVGAGTSGRLGVLEAAEMPPTFGTDPDTGAGGDGGRQRRPSCTRRKAWRTTTRKARGRSRGCARRRRTSWSACRPAG